MDTHRLHQSTTGSVYRVVILLWLLLLFAQPAFAGWGSDAGGGAADQTGDVPVITTTNTSDSEFERALDVESSLTKTDGGANGSFTIGTNTVLDFFHSTGATTRQSLLDYILNDSPSTGDVVYYNGANWVLLNQGANGTFLGVSSGTLGYYTPAGGGTVTSVALSLPSIFTVSGSPVTTSGTLTGTLANQSANEVFAGPTSGGAAAPTFRALVADDIPSIAASKITSGTLDDARLPSTVVHDDESNTYSGTTTQDMSASTISLKIPGKAAASEGEIAYNSNKLQIHDGTAARNVVTEPRTITAGTGLSGGGDLSADRTINLDTVDETNGGTGQTTITTGDVLYGSSSNTISKLAIGSTDQVLTVSGGVPAWATPSSSAGFGGDGSDGAITISTTTNYTGPIQKNASSFTVNASQTLNINDGPGIINSTGAITVNGTIDLTDGPDNGGAGGPSNSNDPGNAGEGPCGGAGGDNQASTGAKGGNGAGSCTSNGGYASSDGLFIGGRAHMTFSGYNSGGGGGDSGSVSGGATGGDGGEASNNLILCAQGAISFGASSSIAGTGGAGTAGTTSTTGDGGGGSGSNLLIASQTSITVTSGAVHTLTGGAGNNTNSSGAGGAGGGRVLWSPSTSDSGTFTSAAGANGGVAAEAGVSVSITGTPNLPLISYLDQQGDTILPIVEVCQRGNIAEIDGKTIASIAADGDALKYFALLSERRMFAWQESTVEADGTAMIIDFLPEEHETWLNAS